MALSVHPLSLGEIELDHSFTVWQAHIGKNIWSPTTAWLILGGEEPILVDTSFRSVEDAKSCQVSPADGLPNNRLENSSGSVA
jgi:hypothetical protein